MTDLKIKHRKSYLDGALLYFKLSKFWFSTTGSYKQVYCSVSVDIQFIFVVCRKLQQKVSLIPVAFMSCCDSQFEPSNISFNESKFDRVAFSLKEAEK